MSAYQAMMDQLEEKNTSEFRELISSEIGKRSLIKIMQEDDQMLANLSPDSEEAMDAQAASSQSRGAAFQVWKKLTEPERKTVRTIMEEAGFPNAAENLYWDLDMMLPA